MTPPVTLLLKEPVAKIHVPSHRSVERGTVTGAAKLVLLYLQRLAWESCVRGT